MENSGFSCPNWLKNGVMYQIFPDRFAQSDRYAVPEINREFDLRSDWGGDPNHLPDENGIVQNNDFFGGNLAGIEEKLPYLAELGVTVIYLNPIFEAFSNHRYDTGDYFSIDPILGTEDDFIGLCKTAKEQGIRIILDGVFNHTGSDSLYFNKKGRYPGLGAYQSKKSPYYSWYKFVHYPDVYESWWGIDILPSLKEEDPSFMDFIIRNEDSVIRHWLRCGASGYRLDVVDELPDLFLDALRTAVKSVDEDAAIIGEVWEDASTKVSYGQKRRYLDGNQLDSVMNYPLRTAILQYIKHDQDAKAFAAVIDSLQANYPDTVFYGLMNFLSTHDTPRIRTVMYEGEEPEQGKQLLFMALILWALMPGIPCIYYGDEIGMTGGKDPFNRVCFQEDKADPEIQLYYRKILAFRKRAEKLESLENLKYKTEKAEGQFFSFQRNGERCRILVAINRSKELIEYPLKLSDGEKMTDFVISGEASFIDLSTFRIGNCSAIAVLIER